MRMTGRMAFVIAAWLLHATPSHASDPLADFGVITPGTRAIAPDFSLPTLEGPNVSLVDYRGKVILINFWATWCAPCREEMPSMQTLWEGYKDKGFVILAVATDGHNRKAIDRFVKKLELDYPVLLDQDEQVRDRYKVVGLPITYFVGRDGNIIGRVIAGRDWASPESVALIEYLLQQ